MTTAINTPEVNKSEEPKAIAVQQPKVMTRFGVPLATLDEAWRMATAIAGSELAPKDYKGKPDNCLIAMQMGAEIGLPPMAAIQNIAVINGRPSVWGDGLLGVIVSHPEYEDHSEYTEGEGDLKTAICRFKRKGKEWKEAKFSVADARKAGLWGKEGPWTKYPDRMLKMRARGFAARDSFPDALRGIGLAEETIDLPPNPSGVVLEAEDPLRDLKEEIADLLINKIQTKPDGNRWTEARVLAHVTGKNAQQLTEMRDSLLTQIAASGRPEQPQHSTAVPETLTDAQELARIGREWTDLHVELAGYDPAEANKWPIPDGDIQKCRDALEMFRQLVAMKRTAAVNPPDPQQPTVETLFGNGGGKKGKRP